MTENPIPIHNLTWIKDSVISEVAKIVRPELTPQIKGIIVTDKQQDAVAGTWGLFIPYKYEIRIHVPSKESFPMIAHKRPTTRFVYDFNTTLDFLAAVIGHEYYHAYQWHHERELYHCKEYLEVGAERYEAIAMEKWNKHLHEIGVMDKVNT